MRQCFSTTALGQDGAVIITSRGVWHVLADLLKELGLVVSDVRFLHWSGMCQYRSFTLITACIDRLSSIHIALLSPIMFLLEREEYLPAEMFRVVSLLRDEYAEDI